MSEKSIVMETRPAADIAQSKARDAEDYSSVLPESVTPAEINQQNRKYWTQPASIEENFENEWERVGAGSTVVRKPAI